MGLIQDAIDDAAEFTASEDNFGVPITLTAKDGEVASLVGTHKKHNTKLDQNRGMIVNGMNASATVHVKNIIAANPNYGFRISDTESEHYQKIELIGHKVSVADVSGVVLDYVVIENYPDETIGLVVLILSYWRP